MNYYISMRLADAKEYEFRFKHEDALRWIDQEFASAGCEVANPVGKMVLSDKILALAKACAADTLAKKTPRVEKYIRSVGLATGRANITVEVRGNSVGF